MQLMELDSKSFTLHEYYLLIVVESLGLVVVESLVVESLLLLVIVKTLVLVVVESLEKF